ncbi:HlyD family secretion protein [Pseudodonghicola flavimaris]|uniref:HlyD family secretion protein n=1 Tax=Pseudodonghicola flavimaris TaxID=3050036 RepID=A0ABT7F0A0_9RHOB|nr:HlyD family secretion protein [Pseudodonghicola flavimaris]MDK3018037.1 HlyD family secretion protein [Pseudodonghicola flavimaris]
MNVLKHHIPTVLIALIGVLGIGLVLWAWHLPPFDGGEIRTSNAYVRGSVTTISAQAAGEVTEVPMQDFATVKRGDVLVRLDDRSAREALAQATAQLDAAQSALKANTQAIRSAQATLAARQATAQAAQAALDTSRASWTRLHKLQDKGVVTTSNVEEADLALRQAEAALTQAQSNVDVARESVVSAKVQTETLNAQIASAQAAVALAGIDLDRRVIRAPVDGRLGQIGVRPGQYVSAGTALVSLVPPQVWVIANVKETELADLHPGQPVTFTVDARHDRAFAGHIAEFSPATASEFSVLGNSTATGNFTKIAQRLPVRIEIDPDQPGAGDLAPGMSVVLYAPRTAS